MDTIKDNIDLARVFVTTEKMYEEDPQKGIWLQLSDYSEWDELKEPLAEEFDEEEDDVEIKLLEVRGIYDDTIYEQGDKQVSELFFFAKEVFDELDEDEVDAFEAYIAYELTNRWKCEYSDVRDFRDKYMGEYSDENEFAEYLIAETGDNPIWKLENENNWLAPYVKIDVEMLARDLFISDYKFAESLTEHTGYVFQGY